MTHPLRSLTNSLQHAPLFVLMFLLLLLTAPVVDAQEAADTPAPAAESEGGATAEGAPPPPPAEEAEAATGSEGDPPPLEDADATAEAVQEEADEAEEAARQAEQAAAEAAASGDADRAAEAAEAAEEAREEADDAAVRAEAQEAVAAADNEGDIDPETGLPRVLLDPGIDTDELTLRLVPLTKDEIAALAEVWFGIVRAKTEEVMAAQIAIMRTEGEVASAAREKYTELVAARKALFDKASEIGNAWEKKGGAEEPRLIELRAYRAAIIVEETRTADFQTLMASALAWVTDRDGGVQLAIDTAVIVVSLIGLWFAARIVRRFSTRWLAKVPNLSKLLQVFLVGVIYWIVFAIGLMVVLSGLGIDISPVFALIGGASFVLAFAFQDTLGNLASGLMIMLNRPFDEGDYVDIGGVGGTVKSVSIVATKVVTPDNQVIVIPNKNVWGNVITNVTASSTRRVDLVFGIGYSDDIPKALQVMEETVKAHPLVLKDPAPMIKVHELGASSVNFICRPWSRTSDYWTVYWDLQQQMKMRFDEEGISIPFPQQDIHVHAVPASEPAAPNPYLAAAGGAVAGAAVSSAAAESVGTATSFGAGDDGHDGDGGDGER